MSEVGSFSFELRVSELLRELAAVVMRFRAEEMDVIVACQWAHFVRYLAEHVSLRFASIQPFVRTRELRRCIRENCAGVAYLGVICRLSARSNFVTPFSMNRLSPPVPSRRMSFGPRFRW